MRFILFLLVFIMAAPVFAGEVRVASGRSIKSERGDGFCQALSNHIPDADVNHRAGVEDVVSADIGGGLKQPILDPIRIPIEIELLDRFDLGSVAGIPGIDLEPIVASVEVYQDGRVLYNGQDISQQAFHKCGMDAARKEAVEAVGGSAADGLVQTPVKKPAPPKQKPVDPNAIEVEILEGQFP